MIDPTTLLLAIMALALGAFSWTSAQAANEAARRHGERACADAGVQWLDQAVQLERVRIRRGGDGWLAVERWYRFEYSRDGQSRHAGRLILLGTRLSGLFGPERQQPAGLDP
ncbi:MAG: hypothetical protein COW59_08990 [Lysobacterales bacterium CG17_big_fil_post_rev_8_21_14_2_50_64_11]|nr:MAG: hypothetical protein COW59_08990 [Xanthomonadales bacterium CG17_big_fil_post_rev_8_21_14_2_50_64_11]PIX60775.1 MAG: DUF3301 domain-containing protein [Xanthomonadales bacterium CG_4_10_14_3_um_filter_64_11]